MVCTLKPNIDETKKEKMVVTFSIRRGGDEFAQQFRRKAFEDERTNGRPKLGD
jgi:hypothetical protein